MLSILSSKGQITLPKDLRDLLKLRSGDKVEFLLQENGRVELVPVTANVTCLKGLLPKPRRKLSIAEMDAAIRKRASGR
ncbi:MAG TPA: AbrB/MazE/SpoVT family DNA-binding domain-containing protein [Gammaproteobacteria bacterium]|nr:AbrB/MazE/SpoVT family DNA-binding domain-containing protein [Gammaproteobacteria bacterium]